MPLFSCLTVLYITVVQTFKDGVYMQPLVPLVFHNLPSLYLDILYLFYQFLAVPTRGSNSDRTVTTLCYTRSHKPRITFITRVRAGKVGVPHYPKRRRSLLIRAET